MCGIDLIIALSKLMNFCGSYEFRAKHRSSSCGMYTNIQRKKCIDFERIHIEYCWHNKSHHISANYAFILMLFFNEWTNSWWTNDCSGRARRYSFFCIHWSKRSQIFGGPHFCGSTFFGLFSHKQKFIFGCGRHNQRNSNVYLAKSIAICENEKQNY